MRSDTIIFSTVTALGIGYSSSVALRFVGVQHADRALAMTIRKTCPRTTNTHSWAPWQESSKISSTSSSSIPSDPWTRSPVAKTRNEVDSVVVPPQAYVAQRRPNAKAYFSLLRPHNIAPSFGLVAAGALVASHSFSSLLDVKVRFSRYSVVDTDLQLLLLTTWNILNAMVVEVCR